MPGTHEDHREQSEIDRQRRERLKKPPPRNEACLAFHEELAGKTPPPPEVEEQGPGVLNPGCPPPAACTCDQMTGGKLCATCARGETDPGMVPFEDLPEETRKNLKPGQCIVWDEERGCYVPVPVPVQEAVGSGPWEPGPCRFPKINPKVPFTLEEAATLAAAKDGAKLHTATDGEDEPFKAPDEGIHPHVPPIPDAEDGEAVFGNVVEGERHAAPPMDPESAADKGAEIVPVDLDSPFLAPIRERLERLEYPEVEVVSKEEAARREARDLEERVFLALIPSHLGKATWEAASSRENYLARLWRLAAEAVENRP